MDGLFFIIFALIFAGWLYIYVPATMASNRNRSAIIWVLISLVGSPLLAVLLLFALGDAAEEKKA